MKKYVYSEEQIVRLVSAIDTLQVRGIQQANAIVVCQQVLDTPVEIIEEKEEGENE